MEEAWKEQNLNLCSATNYETVNFGNTKQYLSLVDLRGKVVFNVVDTVSVIVLIGTAFMENYFTSIYHMESRLKPPFPRSIDILSTGPLDKLALATTSVQQEKDTTTVIMHSEVNLKITSS